MAIIFWNLSQNVFLYDNDNNVPYHSSFETWLWTIYIYIYRTISSPKLLSSFHFIIMFAIIKLIYMFIILNHLLSNNRNIYVSFLRKRFYPSGVISCIYHCSWVSWRNFLKWQLFLVQRPGDKKPLDGLERTWNHIPSLTGKIFVVVFIRGAHPCLVYTSLRSR